jgi:hypothetical protein
MAKRFGGFTPEQLGKIIPEMQGMQADEQAKFLAATPGAAARVGKMSEIAQKRIGMAYGGMVKGGYADGGIVEPSDLDTAKQASADKQKALQDAKNAQAANPEDETLVTAVSDAEAAATLAGEGLSSAQSQYKTMNMPTNTEAVVGALKDPTGMVTKADVEKIEVTDDQKIDPNTGQLTGDAPTGATTTAAPVQNVTGPEKTPAVKVEPTLTQEGVQGVVDKLVAATGKPSDEALADAANMSPDQLAQLGLDAAQIKEAQTVVAPDARKVEDGELIEGSTVDMSRVKKETNFEAVTGAPSTDATVQGQLTGLMEDFEGSEPPAWAAGAMRQAAAMMASRGLSSSSMAGQAVVQAAMESALPIAQMDSQTFAKFESQNLSNRQQTAMFAAEKRAEFLGLEFNQDFQSRVANAAKISDIANMNFTAEQNVALENARMAQSVDMANLSAANAKVLADAAAMTQTDLTNLNNRQQTQVQNAKAFLDMDMANLSNTQQTTLFKAQQITNSMFSDQAAANAAAQFNASSEMQTDQFFQNLTSTVSMFNTEQMAARDRFNAGEANAMEQFNKSIVNMREQFNGTNSLVVEQANAAWAQAVSTADTAAQNIANRDEAMAASEMTSLAFNGLLQESRDLMSFAWQTEDSNATRATQLAIAKITSDDAKAAAAAGKKASLWGAVGNFAAAIVR